MKLTVKKIMAITAGLVMVSAVAACGHRYHHHSFSEERADYVVEKISEELELNEGQVAKLDNLKGILLEARGEMWSVRRQGKDEVKALLDQPTLDQGRVLTLYNRHIQTMNENAPRLVAAFGGFYDSLSVEQQQELKEHIEKRMERHDRFSE